jgi:hypothetical protein
MMADYYEFNYDISEMEQAKILASRRLNKF